MNKKMYKGDKVKRFLVHIPMYMLSFAFAFEMWWMSYDGNQKEKKFLKRIPAGIICHL